MAATYSEKLKDPRWQKKRLEILAARGWACEICADKEETLNVDHKLYRKGAAPWEYGNKDLQVLCETCHRAVTRLRESMNEYTAELSTDEFNELWGYAVGIIIRNQFKESPTKSDLLMNLDAHAGQGVLNALQLGIFNPEKPLTKGELCALYRKKVKA